ncbi:MAG TPA: aminotransferase class IV, partial [Candidatus Polarisedimenticolaceae bacterium]|nr:aminotransferase class IV [Candidatus Polarisedimenticolaceae bacterium]
MRATVSVNGELSDGGSAVVSVFDQGFLYGEGVYETIRTYGGVPFLFDRHTARLRRSASLLALDVPFDDDELRARVDRTVDAHRPVAEAYVRILLTRGVGELSYDPRTCRGPTLVIIVKDFVAPSARAYSEGIALVLAGVRRNHP